jgi:hypothetical protein
MRITLHIEHLVLDGLPAADGARLRAAVEGELARLLASGGLRPDLAAGGAVARLAAPPIRLDRGGRPDAIGRAVARSVHAGIGDPRGAGPAERGGRS